MRKLSILTAVAAIFSVTLIVACGENRNYRGRYGVPGGHCSPYSGGYDRYGYDRYNQGYGYDRYNQGYGYDRYNQGYGHDRYNQGYDPRCGHVQRYPQHGSCGHYGQGWHGARAHGVGGSWCVQVGGRIGGGYHPYYASISGSDSTEIVLCNLNEEPSIACPQGLSCQAELGEGDTGICL